MIEFLVSARAALAGVHPQLPFLVTAAVVGLLVYLWRKLHAKSFDALPTGLKAIPGLVIAGLLSAMSTDGPILTVIVDAVIGGFTAAGGHHALKDISWIPYGNPPKAETPKPPVLPMLLVFVAALALGNSGCTGGGDKAQAAMVQRAEALAWNGAAISLELVAHAERKRVDAIAKPTEDEIITMERNLAHLKRARDALKIVKAYIEGTKDAGDHRQALGDAAEALKLVVASLKAQNVRVPERVEEGIALAAALAKVGGS